MVNVQADVADFPRHFAIEGEMNHQATVADFWGR